MKINPSNSSISFQYETEAEKYQLEHLRKEFINLGLDWFDYDNLYGSKGIGIRLSDAQRLNYIIENKVSLVFGKDGHCDINKAGREFKNVANVKNMIDAMRYK